MTVREAMEIESAYIVAHVATTEWVIFQQALAGSQEIDYAAYVAFEQYTRPKVQAALKRACQRVLDLNVTVKVKTMTATDKPRKWRMTRRRNP